MAGIGLDIGDSPGTVLYISDLSGPFPGDHRIDALADDPHFAELHLLLRDLRAEERAIVSSFDFRLVAAFRAYSPRVATGLLFEDGHPWRGRVDLAAALLRPSALNPDLRLVTPERLDRWRRGGRGVFVFTVDLAADVTRLAALGVTGFFSNDPGAARTRSPA
jgi:glycerophosphoryl diester phosphodiesterase